MPAPYTLADLMPNEEGCIHSVSGNDTLSQRLSEIGFTPGQKVRLVRLAPLGDPLQIRIRGFHIALRRNEARRIVLSPA
jgi:ferrous iron transport protein A